MRIAGTAALVTGAASGLGAATAAALAAQGALVTGLDLPAAIERAARGPAPDGVTLVGADVTDEQQVGASFGSCRTGRRRCGSSSTAPASPRPRGCWARPGRTTSSCSAAW